MLFVKAISIVGPSMDTPSRNARHIDEFNCYIADRKSVIRQQYEKRLTEDLSRQQWQGCFQRNVVAALESFYDDALRRLHSIPFDAREYEVRNGMSDLTRQILLAFNGVIDEFLLFVVDKHRTSCALSNFPEEHKPDKDYIHEVKRDIVGLWRQFALDTNSHFLEIS